jgi:ribosomal protein L37AE/L43A
MARRRKGSDPGLALIKLIFLFIVMAALLINIADPKAGGALIKLLSQFAVAVAVVGGSLYVAFALVSKPPTLNTRRIEDFKDPDRRPPSPAPQNEEQRFARVQWDIERERTLSLEQKLEQIDWFQFEKVVAMLYSSRGCQVERRGGANPDGGIDLVVRSGTEQFAVQCKFWKAYEVGVRQVRELIGALQDARIPEGVIVSIKGFTDSARELAARHKIELIGRTNLLGMLNDARFTPHIGEINAIMDSDEKRCPRCERRMVQRTSSKDGSKFWGCSGYPRCRYTMNALAIYPRALQWGPGVATPQPRVKLNTADSGGSTPLQTALAHKTPSGLKKVSPQPSKCYLCLGPNVLPMS